MIAPTAQGNASFVGNSVINLRPGETAFALTVPAFDAGAHDNVSAPEQGSHNSQTLMKPPAARPPLARRILCRAEVQRRAETSQLARNPVAAGHLAAGSPAATRSLQSGLEDCGAAPR
jgi:hypothetical protein